MVVHRTTAVIIFGSPTKFLVVLGLPDYHYFDPCRIRTCIWCRYDVVEASSCDRSSVVDASSDAVSRTLGTSAVVAYDTGSRYRAGAATGVWRTKTQHTRMTAVYQGRSSFILLFCHRPLAKNSIENNKFSIDFYRIL